MLALIRKVLALLSPRERRQSYLLFIMSLIVALLEVIGIASIMPFMAVLVNPDMVKDNVYLNTVYSALEFTDPGRFLLFLGVMVFVALIISISSKAFTTWAISHFTQMREYSVGRRLLAGYLRQPYEWFLNQHSADLGKSVLSEAQLVVRGALVPLMEYLARITVVVAVLLLLVVVNPIVALVVGIAMGGAYSMIYIGLRRMLDRVGTERVAANEKRFKVVSETFGGIKELKLGALEDVALRRFDGPAQRFARTQVLAYVMGILPRYALEIISFGGILILTLFLMRSGNGLQDTLPMIALYALAGYRLMPALQESYRTATSLRFSGPALDRLHGDLQALAAEEVSDSNSSQRMIPERRIQLKDATYSYPNAPRPAVAGLNLEIQANKTVGLVGRTGSGKTTAVDLILGLLKPQCGALYVDGAEITQENRRSWQRTLGYVPQQIFLADDTVAANIAFGIEKEQINQEAVEYAASVANLHEFVTRELPMGYQTFVGERGTRLSGGQRQRIGIARALYHQPKVLILDEATSALDNLMEQAVMEAVQNLAGEITIIMIAHRLSTLRDCDSICVLEHGRIVDEGSFDELTQKNEQFRIFIH